MDMTKKKGIDGFTLKIIAIVTMFIDHTAAVFLERFLAQNTDDHPLYGAVEVIDVVMRCIGRIAFPIFIFCMVQGFTYTHSKAKYAIRLGLFALISEVPFGLAFSDSVFSMKYQNVFFTLFLGYLFMWFTDYVCKKIVKPWLGYLGILTSALVLGAYLSAVAIGITQSYSERTVEYGSAVIFFLGNALLVIILEIVFCLKKPFLTLTQVSLSLTILGLLMWAADLLRTDYGAFGVLAIATAYFFRKNKHKSFGFMLIPLIIASVVEIIAVVDLVLIKDYNGEKGKSMKYFFYAFYPAHLLIIAFIAMLIGL